MTVSEIEPIVVQAVECLFPDVRHHKYVFNILRERGGTLTRLALLKYCDKDSEKLRAASYQSHPHFWMDEISPIFRTMEDAEEWVKSLEKSQS